MSAASSLLGFDRYTRTARIAPAVIVGLPVGLAFAVWFPERATSFDILGAAVVLFALTALLSQLGRDQGKRKEARLVATWGGMPTQAKLRHRDAGLNAETRKRYHAKLQALLSDVALPTEADEQLDHAAADRVYEACVAMLRERTRNRVRFALVHEENMSYGFRRNLWALKPVGLVTAALGIAACLLALSPSLRGGDAVAGVTVVAILVDAFLLGLWLLVITPAWVRIAANAYADRLLAACELL